MRVFGFEKLLCQIVVLLHEIVIQRFDLRHFIFQLVNPVQQVVEHIVMRAILQLLLANLHHPIVLLGRLLASLLEVAFPAVGLLMGKVALNLVQKLLLVYRGCNLLLLIRALPPYLTEQVLLASEKVLVIETLLVRTIPSLVEIVHVQLSHEGGEVVVLEVLG